MPPADDATLDKPSEALDVVWEAVSFALVATSEVVEACLRLFLRRRNRDGRRSAREVQVTGMVAVRLSLLLAKLYRIQDGGGVARARFLPKTSGGLGRGRSAMGILWVAAVLSGGLGKRSRARSVSKAQGTPTASWSDIVFPTAG